MSLKSLVPGTLMLAWALVFAPGCKPDICKDENLKNLTAEQRCKDCKPRDDELLARLNPTQLPWPVRKTLERCADQIHASDPSNFVTKQALRDCVNAEPGLDGNDKVIIAELINRSNLMEQSSLDDYHALCLANVGVSTSVTSSPAAPAVGRDAPTVPPAPAAPAARPAAAPATTIPTPPPAPPANPADL
jgi:hypothetical protein